MARTYGSFVIRWWHLDRGERRIEVEHVQSGSRTRVPSLAAALAWMAAHWGDATAQPGPPPTG